MPEIPDKDLELKPQDRKELKRTLGPVAKGDMPEEYTDREPIITVGDVVTDTLLDQGIEPDVGIVDGKTRRGKFKGRNWRKKETVRLENPPSFITKESWSVLEDAISSDENVLIQVDGEEDMLSLVAIALCPLDGIVIYGVPSEGMVINEVSKDIKEEAWEIINNMIEVDDGR